MAGFFLIDKLWPTHPGVTRGHVYGGDKPAGSRVHKRRGGRGCDISKDRRLGSWQTASINSLEAGSPLQLEIRLCGQNLALSHMVGAV